MQAFRSTLHRAACGALFLVAADLIKADDFGIDNSTIHTLSTSGGNLPGSFDPASGGSYSPGAALMSPYRWKFCLTSANSFGICSGTNSSPVAFEPSVDWSSSYDVAPPTGPALSISYDMNSGNYPGDNSFAQTPEPASIFLLSTVVAIIGFVTWKRRKKTPDVIPLA
jgi:hypothetical protein